MTPGVGGKRVTIYVCVICGAGYLTMPVDICGGCGTENAAIVPMEFVPAERDIELERLREGLKRVRDWAEEVAADREGRSSVDPDELADRIFSLLSPGLLSPGPGSGPRSQ